MGSAEIRAPVPVLVNSNRDYISVNRPDLPHQYGHKEHSELLCIIYMYIYVLYTPVHKQKLFHCNLQVHYKKKRYFKKFSFKDNIQ